MEESRKRNMDRRRETSRHAARDRRGKEADIFVDLKEVVPVVQEQTVTHVDRIALLRVAATLCRFRRNAGESLKCSKVSRALLESSKSEGRSHTTPYQEDLLTECMDGFIILCDSDATILYVTESVSLFLGLTQTDLVGFNMNLFTHPVDLIEFFECSKELRIGSDETDSRSLSLRLKSVISPRGRSLNLKSAVNKPIAFTVRCLPSRSGKVILLHGCSTPAGQGSFNSSTTHINKSSDSSSGSAFMTRHTCDMRISYVSDALVSVLKSENRSLMGASFYDLVHPADVGLVTQSIGELLEKGHTRTPYYRLLASQKRLAWVQTEATTISHTTRGQKGQYIICIHHMLGLQSETDYLALSTESNPAGIQVHIKRELDERDMEFSRRQTNLFECLPFTPLHDANQPFKTINDRQEKPGKRSLDNIFNWLAGRSGSESSAFNNEQDESIASYPVEQILHSDAQGYHGGAAKRVLFASKSSSGTGCSSFESCDQAVELTRSRMQPFRVGAAADAGGDAMESSLARCQEPRPARDYLSKARRFEYLGDGSCRAAAMGDGQQQQQPGGHTAGLLAPPALAASTDAISAGFTQQQRGWSHGAALTRQPDHSLQYTPDSRGCSPALPQTGPLLLPISEGLAGGQGRDEGPMLSALPSSYTSPATKMNEAKGAPPPVAFITPEELCSYAPFIGQDDMMNIGHDFTFDQSNHMFTPEWSPRSFHEVELIEGKHASSHMSSFFEDWNWPSELLTE